MYIDIPWRKYKIPACLHWHNLYTVFSHYCVSIVPVIFLYLKKIAHNGYFWQCQLIYLNGIKDDMEILYANNGIIY